MTEWQVSNQVAERVQNVLGHETAGLHKATTPNCSQKWQLSVMYTWLTAISQLRVSCCNSGRVQLLFCKSHWNLHSPALTDRQFFKMKNCFIRKFLTCCVQLAHCNPFYELPHSFQGGEGTCNMNPDQLWCGTRVHGISSILNDTCLASKDCLVGSPVW